MNLRSGGLAAWSIRHPVGVSMIALAVIVLGMFTLSRLAVDLLPHIIYPEIRVRIIDDGVPASVMEDKVTRQLEEQLAVTEDAIGVQSDTNRGLTTVDLAFEYGKDIDIALRDASTRLDRAKRFLPELADPPIIYKLDPSQIPVMEFVISSSLRSGVELRRWTDDVFSKWFLNLPGVAAAEVGGGLLREIQVIPDQQRLAGIGLSYRDLIAALQTSNSDEPIGRLQMPDHEFTGRISGRFASIDEIRRLPIARSNGNTVYLGDVAQVVDSSEDERIKVRADGVGGIKLSIQKQPAANTTAVVAVVKERLAWLQAQRIIPPDISATVVADQSSYILQSLKNASLAAISGALLAMSVVYLFLGNLRRTLIIGSAIPIAIMFTCVLMGLGGLTLNVMTLGGLALGVGMLVDNTIVMLENIYRHQCNREDSLPAASQAAAEVNSAIVAATSTNLSAVMPFLFVGGLTGLLFRELVFTISAAIFASMIIALTLVPAFAARVRQLGRSRMRRLIDGIVEWLQRRYAVLVGRLLPWRWPVVALFVAGLAVSLPVFLSGKQIFLPKLDDGRVRVVVTADIGISLAEMDQKTWLIEQLFAGQPETETVFTLVGGSIFGRTQRETPSRSTIIVQLKPLAERRVSSGQWIQRMNRLIAEQRLAGFKVNLTQRGIRGIRTNRGDDDISLRLQGGDLDQLRALADMVADRLRAMPGLRNVAHSAEEEQFEIAVKLDRDRAAQLGLNLQDLTEAAQIALQGQVVSDFLDGDRSYDIRLRLAQAEMSSPQDLESIILFPASGAASPVYLGTVASIQLLETPASIKRDNQMRIVELTASLGDELTLGEALQQIDALRQQIELPAGYTLYDGGSKKVLQEQRQLTDILLALALFLVFVVMAIQYESLRNPLIIIISVPFAAIGVAAGVYLLALPLSMPVWLGMIMLIGIVVNNAILLVEYIELARRQGRQLNEAIIEAARLRLRPILMTTLSTVVGMLPLALGWGDGAEMLQPLAVTVVWGLSFSMLVSLLLVPLVYYLFHAPLARGRRQVKPAAG
ncbi:efflux RND transporter permease subunit [Marinobacterium arenosum]|uniref:efflux RND transporter permease subunit n=1 Tax=Marinobacterium arenosum TaxID=2862496 RepID=UPI001C97F073|nr:efflux RND transporter permease subunit [Marinobacterium arenosum]MBY4677503.1 efflux RND transporter permease subunit [Marinobacterium arenosum]